MAHDFQSFGSSTDGMVHVLDMLTRASLYSQRWRSRMSRTQAHTCKTTMSNLKHCSQIFGVLLVERDWTVKETPPTLSVPDVTDLSETSRAALPPPARAVAFELLLAVMFISTPATHLKDKHTWSHLLNPGLNPDFPFRFFLLYLLIFFNFGYKVLTSGLRNG